MSTDAKKQTKESEKNVSQKFNREQKTNLKRQDKGAYFICFTIVLFPDSPAPENENTTIRNKRNTNAHFGGKENLFFRRRKLFS